jgi:hypothetical protein
MRVWLGVLDKCTSGRTLAFANCLIMLILEMSCHGPSSAPIIQSVRRDPWRQIDPKVILKVQCQHSTCSLFLLRGRSKGGLTSWCVTTDPRCICQRRQSLRRTHIAARRALRGAGAGRWWRTARMDWSRRGCEMLLADAVSLPPIHCSWYGMARRLPLPVSVAAVLLPDGQCHCFPLHNWLIEQSINWLTLIYSGFKNQPSWHHE